MFNGLPPEAAYEWYEHDGHWQNRIIRGPSQEVMGSLLAREEMRGTVQMVYYDPPYGIDYGKTIQTDMRTRDDDVKDKGTADAAMQKCFRDAYRRGIHSYLGRRGPQPRADPESAGERRAASSCKSARRTCTAWPS